MNEPWAPAITWQSLPMRPIVCTCNIIKNVLWQGGWSCRYLSFIFPLLGSFLSEPLSGFYAATKGCRQSRTRRFFLPITLGSPGCQGRICKKCTSKRREQARQSKFAPVKNRCRHGQETADGYGHEHRRHSPLKREIIFLYMDNYAETIQGVSCNPDVRTGSRCQRRIDCNDRKGNRRTGGGRIYRPLRCHDQRLHPLRLQSGTHTALSPKSSMPKLSVTGSFRSSMEFSGLSGKR